MPDTTAYPLSWPLGRPRTHESHREKARFAGTTKEKARRLLTVAEAVARILAELNRYTKVGQDWRVNRSLIIISTNVPTRRDGLPRGGLSEPADPGAAVYFQLDGQPYCLPCDKYTRVADNLAAIAAHIEASRAIERHGVATAHDVYAAFPALPEQAGPSSGSAWWQVLSVPPTAGPDKINSAYRELAKVAHPDQPFGRHEWMQQLNEARRLGLSTNQSS